MAVVKNIYTCIEKVRDKNDRILGYVLKDSMGNVDTYEAKRLKKEIRSGWITVDNLMLTSDNRLVSTEKHELFDMGKIRGEQCNSELFDRYQDIFDSIGVNVVGAIYMVIPEAGETADSVIVRSLEKYGIHGCTAQTLVNIPEKLVGKFAETVPVDDEYCIEMSWNKSAILDLSFVYRMVILVLHKDGQFKAVMCSEIQYDRNSPGSIKSSDRKEWLMSKLAIATVNNNLDVQVKDVGAKISSKEKEVLAHRLVNSELVYWAQKDTARKMIERVGKKEASVRMSSYGVKSLALPFTAVFTLGAIILSIAAVQMTEVASDAEEMTPFERYTLNKIGYGAAKNMMDVRKGK